MKLAKLYFELSIVPGMSIQVVASCADGFRLLTKSKKLLTVEDMRLPWKPIYEALSQDLFLTRRQFEYTCVAAIELVCNGLILFLQSIIVVHGLHC